MPTHHFAPSQPIESHRRAVPDTDLLELQADVLALVDETLISTGSADKGRPVTTRREDHLGERLRRSVMFSDVRRA
jgi:hypothetical protein